MTKPILACFLCALLSYGCSTQHPTTIPADKSLTEDTDWYARMDELPRHYRGVFQWNGSPRQQEVEIWFDSVGVADSGDAWLARGRGIYRTSGIAHIDIRARIDFETGEFRMRESNPDAPGFATNGQHVGQITDGFRKVEATWRGEDGHQGKLRLNAVDAQN